MEYKKLGKTELSVSVVGLGGIPIQRINEEEAFEIIKECKSQGINFIDTARGYTVSEHYIGQALKKLGRDSFYIATKGRAFTYEAMKNEIAKSLETLDIDYIDLYQVHNPSTEEMFAEVVSENGALKALEEAKAAGLIRHIGITSHNHKVITKAIEHGHFETVQFPFNPKEDQGREALIKAKENNIGVIAMKPIAGGAFSLPALSIKFILNQDFITVAIPGMDSIEQVKENAAIGNHLSPLSPEEIQLIDQEVVALGEDFCRRCGYCLPCPQQIDIPGVMVLENYYKRYKLYDWAETRYNAMTAKASSCIECGICETRCPYHIPIRKKMKSIKETFGE
ncbi:MAG: aldo/keto reductase [Tissierellales bacterium]|nr:aldo/keto reductase [Tissierellales bacterium]MBN2827364.1 aldo/keto reductase [Tissierellales bacterium]